jgi:hypothetical protein
MQRWRTDNGGGGEPLKSRLGGNMTEQSTDVLFHLAKQAALTGDSLDRLFRINRPDLFRESDRQVGGITQDEIIKGNAKTDSQQGCNGV